VTAPLDPVIAQIIPLLLRAILKRYAGARDALRAPAARAAIPPPPVQSVTIRTSWAP
jgi:hypothetical protein